ncbi:DsbA family protein [Reinekea sp. G2M2-21]|uniref:DsbA family oxidoreductase n=1 Tax=Reinekea sp. G2M2-21 TaxID=2788942 RepID=UPI0018ABD37A|nr:DsbA family protein [Reinekea sp. G2M2-21]
MRNSLIIDYYTDVLCVWAWIAQKRVDELHKEWGNRIQFRYHYLNLFADTQKRIGEGWQAKGGFEGFSEHVQEAAAPFPDAEVSDQVWRETRPKSSLNAHLLLKALELQEGSQAAARYSVKVRQQFFVQNKDIGDLEILLALVKDCGFEPSALQKRLYDGSAAAALASDYQTAQELSVKGSPSWIMNNGRQTLYGNVGYRVLTANVREHLEHDELDASWC